MKASKPYVELEFATDRTLGYGVGQLEKLILESVSGIEDQRLRVRFNSKKRDSFLIVVTLLESKKNQHLSIMTKIAKELHKIGLVQSNDVKIER